MKKYLILAAFAAVALGACTKVETTKETVDEPILFSAYSGRTATKAKPIGDAVELATQGGFGVFAYYTGNSAYTAATTTIPNFMFNQNVEGTISGTSVSAWTYSPIKYWPNNDSNQVNGEYAWVDKVSFFAYAPYTAVSNKTTGATANTVGITKVTGNETPISTENPTVTYVVATNPAQSVDLLYNDANTIDLTKQGVSGKVTFNFKHALTRLGFTVEGVFDETAPGSNDVDTNTKIYITSLSVTKAGGVPTGGTFDLYTKQWTANTTYAPLGVSTSNIPADLKAGGSTGVTTTPVNLLNNDEYFMLLPDSAAAEYSITIEYDVITTDAALSGGKSTITNNITKKASIKLEAGKAYTIALQLGMTTVKLSATVVDWDDQTATPIWLPVNNS